MTVRTLSSNMREAEVMDGGLQFTWGEEDRNSIILEFLKTRSYFTDVTLVSSDQKEFFCHKVVLSACSKFFENILSRRHHQPNLILFLAGVDSKDLGNIINFLYEGLVKVSMDDVETFVTAANILEIKGITDFKVDDVIFDKKEKRKRGRKKKLVPNTRIELEEPLTQVEVLVESSAEESTSQDITLGEQLSEYDFTQDAETNKSSIHLNNIVLPSNNSTIKSNKERMKEVESKFSKAEILKAYKLMKQMKKNQNVKLEEQDTKDFVHEK